MLKSIKLSLIALVFCCATYIAIADRGGLGRKSKVHFNISTLSTLKNSIPFNLKYGLNYSGSTRSGSFEAGNSIFNNTVISYRKGNTIYIVPYKQKILIPSYTADGGYKLIIRHK